MHRLRDITAIEAAARDDGFDVRLFTVLGISQDAVVRLYSSNPAAYPIGGSKSLARDIAPEWTRTCIADRNVYLGLTPGALAQVFADHDVIASLGCGAIANIPVVEGDTTIAVLCLLTPAGGIAPRDEGRLKALGAAAHDAVRAALAAADQSERKDEE